MERSELSALIQRTSTWSQMHGLFEGAHPPSNESMVKVASTFAYLCSPSTSTRRNLDVAARFLLLFFCLDDAPPTKLPTLTESPETWNAGPITTALRAWRDDYFELDKAPPRLRDRFIQSFHDNVHALAHEPAMRAHQLSLEEHWNFRRRSIFMNPYIDHWLISVNAEIFDFEANAQEARQLVIDLVLLSNDLGSVERDSENGLAPDDLNLVPTYMRQRSWTEQQAIESLVIFHNQMVSKCRDLLAGEVVRGPQHNLIADILMGIADGNIAALEVLRSRYPGTEKRISRLDTIGTRSRPRWKPEG